MVDIHAQLPDIDGQPPTHSEAMGINSHHQVVGWYSRGSVATTRAFIWLPEPAYGLDAGAHDLNDLLDVPNSPPAMAFNLNDQGLVSGASELSFVGDVLKGEVGGRAIVWDVTTWDDPQPVWYDINDLVENQEQLDVFDGVATDISDDQDAIAVGWVRMEIPCLDCSNVQRVTPVFHAFRLTLDQNLVVEFAYEPETTTRHTFARGIASSNTQITLIVGDEEPEIETCPDGQGLVGCPLVPMVNCFNDHLRTAIEWADTTVTTLTKVEPGQGDPPSHHWGLGVNVEGHLVGMGGIYGNLSYPTCSLRRAVFWEDSASDPEVLEPQPNPAHEAQANAITNPDGEGFVFVVGNNLEGEVALLWRWDDPGDPEQWTAYLLENLITSECDSEWSVLSAANDISDHLWIVGWGLRSESSAQRAYLLVPTSDCPWDLTGDGCVDGADLGQLLAQWGDCKGLCPADFNCDGKVDGADHGQLLANWGPCDDQQQCEEEGPDSQTISDAEQGNFVPLYMWLLNEGHDDLAAELAIVTGLFE